MASQQHPALVHHLSTATAATAATAANDTNSALVLGRNAHLAEGAVHERLGVRPIFLAWLVRLLTRSTSLADEAVPTPRASWKVRDFYFGLVSCNFYLD